MKRYENSVGVLVPSVLLPRTGTDYSKWAVVACDQYTSQPAYWEEAEALVADAPSTLKLILPEAYLGKPGEAERIQKIQRAMRTYLDTGVLREQEQGFVLVRREAEGKTRLGLILALDLEEYDYAKGSQTLIRATEGTIVERIPPRLRIREGAPMELPHILVLIDDPGRTVIEPLAVQADKLPLLYDTELMLGGGHVTGRLVADPELIGNVLGALAVLNDADAFQAKYGQGHKPMLFAMGDGNHSFATAKAAWEQLKPTLSEAERKDHPARFALVEIENVHDEGIVFEPIHRVLFGVDSDAAISRIGELLASESASVRLINCKCGDLERLTADTPASVHALPFFCGESCGLFEVKGPLQQLPVGTLQRGHRHISERNAVRRGGLYPRRRCRSPACGKARCGRFSAAGHEKERAIPYCRIRRSAPPKNLLNGRGL